MSRALIAMSAGFDSKRLIEGRARLAKLAEEGMHTRTREQAELERLQEYLRMWAHAERSEREQLQCPHAVPYINEARPTIDSYSEDRDYHWRLDRWARPILDACIDNLVELPDGWMMRAGLRVKYLNEGMSRKAG